MRQQKLFSHTLSLLFQKKSKQKNKHPAKAGEAQLPIQCETPLEMKNIYIFLKVSQT